MLTNIRDSYKVTKSTTQQSYEYQLGLIHNEEYKKRVENTFLQIVNLFKNKYPQVKIEPPRGREKSEKSLKEKIDKLEIERLCKLYAIEGISGEEKKRLYNLVINKIERESQAKNEKVENEIYNIFIGNIKDFKQIEELIQLKEISDNMKTACLRVAKINLERQGKEKIAYKIEECYGEEIAKKTKRPESNLLHWECINQMESSEEEREKLHKPMEYLKAKDLRAFKIVIANVPDEIQVESQRLKQLVEKRKQSKDDKERKKYDDLCCIQLEKDFANYLMKNKELLEKMNVRILPAGYKQKTKRNGYIADHLKFCYIDHPEYTFELQLRSIYREELSRANGPAAHDKRSGKKRIFPNTENKEVFMKQLKYMTPKYTILKNDSKGKYKIERCSLLENMLEYYLGYIDLKSDEYKKAIQYLTEYEKEK